MGEEEATERLGKRAEKGRERGYGADESSEGVVILSSRGPASHERLDGAPSLFSIKRRQHARQRYRYTTPTKSPTRLYLGLLNLTAPPLRGSTLLPIPALPPLPPLPPLAPPLPPAPRPLEGLWNGTLDMLGSLVTPSALEVEAPSAPSPEPTAAIRGMR